MYLNVFAIKTKMFMYKRPNCKWYAYKKTGSSHPKRANRKNITDTFYRYEDDSRRFHIVSDKYIAF